MSFKFFLHFSPADRFFSTFFFMSKLSYHFHYFKSTIFVIQKSMSKCRVVFPLPHLTTWWQLWNTAGLKTSMCFTPPCVCTCNFSTGSWICISKDAYESINGNVLTHVGIILKCILCCGKRYYIMCVCAHRRPFAAFQMK